MNVNHVKTFKQLEEMAASLRHERSVAERAVENARQCLREKEVLQARLASLEARYGNDERAAASSLELLSDTHIACREQGEVTETLKSPSMRSRPVEVEVASLPALLVDRDSLSSEQNEEEEPLTPLFGLGDIWQTKASTSTRDAYKAMTVPSMDISTCVGSDIDPASFNHSCEDVEDLGTSFMDEGNDACVTYAMSEGGSSFVDQCNDIDDMYDQLENCSHLHRARAKERRTFSAPGLRRATLVHALLKSMWTETSPKSSNAKHPKACSPRKTGLRKEGSDMLHDLLSSQLH
jgi:hypothetical protein